jgi:PAS domain S-box-containing protein
VGHRDLEELSKEELIRELRKLQAASRAATELEAQTSARYADLDELAPVGYCTLDLEGRICEVNRAGAALLGCARDGLTGRSFGTVAPLADARAFEVHLERCAQGNTRVTSEIVFKRGRRGTRVVQVVSEPLYDASGRATAFRTIMSDISEAKELEAKLRLLALAGETFHASLDYGETLEAIAHLAVPALADACVLDVLGEGGGVERQVVFADPRSKSGGPRGSSSSSRVPAGTRRRRASARRASRCSFRTSPPGSSGASRTTHATPTRCALRACGRSSWCRSSVVAAHSAPSA